jgi:hypothetical protein
MQGVCFNDFLRETNCAVVADSRGICSGTKDLVQLKRFKASTTLTHCSPIPITCQPAPGHMTISRLISIGKHSFRQLRNRPKDIPVTFNRTLFSRLSTSTRPSTDFQQSRTYAMVNAAPARDADYGHFSLLQSFPVENAPITLSKWRSQRTGLTVVVGNHESPITNGYFTIASEIFDDTGRPHTLEHLIFLGSKEYPYKGVLDQLANRAGSNGTNAWTANDRKLSRAVVRGHN